MAARLLLCQCHPRLTQPGFPHAPAPSAIYERLRKYIAKQMRMSPIDQPLMLLELLGR
jgi:hypothetical protein